MDLVGRFRLFENDGSNAKSTEDDIVGYLASYSSEALTEPELVNHMMKHISKQVNLAKLFQIKRSGKDLDSLYWSFGKIHGLENIAFVDEKQLEATKGNPVAIQRLVNQVEEPSARASSFESAQSLLQKSLDEYKNAVN